MPVQRASLATINQTRFSRTWSYTKAKAKRFGEISKLLLQTIGLMDSPKRMQPSEFYDLDQRRVALKRNPDPSGSVLLYRFIGIIEYFKLRLGKTIYPHAGKDYSTDPKYLAEEAERHGCKMPFMPLGFLVRAPKTSPFISMTWSRREAFILAQLWGGFKSRFFRPWILAIEIPRAKVYATKLEELSFASRQEGEVLTLGGYSWKDVVGAIFKRDHYCR